MLLPSSGDFGLVRVRGPMGVLIRFGQLLNGDSSEYAHALVCLDSVTGVEAKPGGARLVDLRKYEGRIVYSRYPLSASQRLAVSALANVLKGTPYSFIDYLALALHRFGIHWLDGRVRSNKHMICSQLVDYCYATVGIHLFNDGRMPSDVTPGDLANLLLEEATATALP